MAKLLFVALFLLKSYLAKANSCNLQCNGVNDTAVLQSALDACSVVLLPSSTICKSCPLEISSNKIFQIDGTLVACDENNWPKQIPRKPFLSSVNTENVTLTGKGSIDGLGEQWWPTLFHPRTVAERPKMVVFQHVSKAVIENLTMLNAASYFIDITGGGTDYIVRNLNITAPNFNKAPNTDGIDIAAHNVLVENVYVSNGDDSICIKSPASNILVRNSIVHAGNGLVIGTATPANVSNVTFTNCTALDTTFGCHIKFKENQEGVVENVRFEKISITQTEKAWWRRISHFDWAGYLIGIHQYDQGRRRRLTSSGSYVDIRNITYESITGSGLYQGEFKCKSKCTGLVFRDVHLTASRKGCVFDGVSGIAVNSTCTPPK